MKKLFIILGVLLALFVILVVAGIAYVKIALPNVGAPENVTVEITPERLARGSYLANHVAICMDCHSTRDWQYFAGPIIPGMEGKGGEAFLEEHGFPGDIYSKNITPAALGNWSDGELIRAITCGVSRDGEPFFPLMPYPAYGKMATEEVYSIVAYLRTLKPIENEAPESKLNFPLNLIVRSIPQPADPQPLPSPSDTLAYGKYLVSVAACTECHTPMEKGEPLPGMDFAGGAEFNLPFGLVRSANITPDEETGIGSWDRREFIGRFKAFADSTASNRPVNQGDFNTIMPWIPYSGMTEDDLGAIYAHLRTQKPVEHRVITFTAKP